MGFNPFKEIKKRLPGGKGNPFERIKGEVERNVIARVEREIKEPLEKEIRQVKRELEKIDPEEIIINAVKKLTKEISGPAIRKLLQVVETLTPKDTGFVLLGVTFHFDPRGKVGKIKELADNPPVGKNGMLRIVETLVPTEIDLSYGFNFALGVNVEALGFSVFANGISVEDFVREINRVT